MKTVIPAPLINRFSSLALRGELRSTNRVVVPAMASGTADVRGFATPATIKHYARLARSGAGIVMVEYSFVEWSGRSEPHQLGADQDEMVPGLAAIARAIHAEGALAILQLTHALGKSERELTGGILLGPSSVPVPVKDRVLEAPVPMAELEITRLMDAFLNAARRANRAGFDGVELHSAHGYGLNQWLSGVTNLRDDQHGGQLAKRLGLLLAIVTAIRAAAPEQLISVRVPGQDFIEGGLSVADMKLVARALEAAGVDLMNVSSGLGGWRRPVERRGEGYLVAEATEIQAAVGIPVIGVGGIETGKYIDEALKAGKFSLAAVGRAILKDPLAWRERVMTKACRNKKCRQEIKTQEREVTYA